MKPDTDCNATRQRLLEAAGEIFAQHGFRCATVREICQRADANVASINYHFGDKERLYAEVLRHAHASALERYPYTCPAISTRPAEDQLLHFIRAYLQRMFDCGRPAWQGQLVAREMAEPTNALNLLVDNYIRPQFELLAGIVHGLLPKGTPRREAELCARSVLAQCLYYHFGRPVLERMHPNPLSDANRVDILAGHIHRFTLTALRHWKSPDPCAPEKSTAGKPRVATAPTKNP